MVKPVSKTEAYLLHPFLVRAHHEWYDTTQETQKPDVIRRSVSYHIQWQNIAESLRKLRIFWDLSNLAYNPRFAQKGAVSFLTDDETAIQEGVAHATITNFTFSHDATGGNLLAVGVTADSPTTTVSATYSGSALTQGAIAQATDRRTAWAGYRASPATGSNTVSVTYGTATAGFGVAVTYSGASGSMNNPATQTGTTQNYTQNVTSATGDMVFDVSVNGGTQTVTAATGQTARLTGNDSYWHYGRASDEAGAATVAMGWNRGTSTANFSHAAVNIPASAATNVTVSAGVNAGTFSAPARTIKINVALARATLTALFSIPTYTILSGVALFVATVVSATFSIPTYVAKASANAYANTLSATFSVITYAIGLGSRILQATLSATFTTVVLTKAGSVWTKIARNASGLWTRSNRNND